MFDFFRTRKLFYALSTIYLLGGVALFYKQKGLYLSVEYTGGTKSIVECQKPPQLEKVKKELKKAFNNQSVEVKTYGSTNVLLITTNYLLDKDSKQANEKVQNLLMNAISQATGGSHGLITEKTDNNFMIRSTSMIGPAVAKEEIKSSQIATLLALLMILLYLLLRFRKWQFSLATVIALIHDCLTVITAFMIARQLGVLYEINSNIVGSLLAGLGYSCNNSVVINDRYRSLLKDLGDHDLKKAGNLAVNQTLGRTLITSFTTFIAVACLFIFGGEALRGFSFSIIISILAGTYSSFFVIPLAYDLQKITSLLRPSK